MRDSCMTDQDNNERKAMACVKCGEPIISGQPTSLTAKGFVHNIDRCKP